MKLDVTIPMVSFKGLKFCQGDLDQPIRRLKVDISHSESDYRSDSRSQSRDQHKNYTCYLRKVKQPQANDLSLTAFTP